MTASAVPEAVAVEAKRMGIEAIGVSVRFGGIKALTDVSFEAKHGEVTGLVGPNGAGKSTLFAVLSGLQPPNSGKVFLNGTDVTRRSPEQRARMGLARTFQHPELFARLTVREHVVLAWRLRHARTRFLTDLATGRGFVPRADRHESAAVDEIIDLLGIGAAAAREPVELGRALASAPSVLLLDEPLAGLDSRDRERLADVLTQVVTERNLCLVLVEHDVEMVLEMASAVSVLDFGSCIAQGTPTEIRVHPAVRAAYLGDI
jgi:branched-chain amino acid transport system ATP-binding protein